MANSNTKYLWDNLKHVFGVALGQEEEKSQASGLSPAKKPDPAAAIWDSYIAPTPLSTDAARAKSCVYLTLEKGLTSCGIPHDQLPTKLLAPGTKAPYTSSHCSKQGPNNALICNLINPEHLCDNGLHLPQP